MGERRDIVDIPGVPDPSEGRGGSSDDRPSQRPWLGVMFECCHVYARIHQTIDGRAYAGHCPKCQTPVHVKIGEGGTNARMFRAN